jgi:alpha-amylase
MKCAIYAIVLCILGSCTPIRKSEKITSREIIYHVVQRSFYDSNGDSHGDLRGLISQLDYLQELGVTSILLLPLYESIYYHNYFPIDFEQVDPTLGTLEDLWQLSDELHQRGMKLYMDMEVQYVTEDHLWYQSAYGNPESPYSNFILWDDEQQLQPSSIVYDLKHFTGYDGRSTRLTTINMLAPEVLAYMKSLFEFFLDPKGDGSFQGGVDGFRIDHMMDDLDNKGRLTDLFSQFWKPLFQHLRDVRPDVVLFAEQADWTSEGLEYLIDADVDMVFSFGICFALRDLDKKSLENASLIFNKLPVGKSIIVFVENHDMDRIASSFESDPEKLRLAATLNLFFGGVPSIYYGQELGMRGSGGFNKYGTTDGNEIPVREAFRWYSTVEGEGMALWYKDTGPWWEDTQLRDYDGISLEEQSNEPLSLLSHYKKLIQISRNLEPLRLGEFDLISSEYDCLFIFKRSLPKEEIIVLANLTENQEILSLSKKDLGITSDQTVKFTSLFPTNGTFEISQDSLKVNLSRFGCLVFQIEY